MNDILTNAVPLAAVVVAVVAAIRARVPSVDGWRVLAVAGAVAVVLAAILVRPVSVDAAWTALAQAVAAWAIAVGGDSWVSRIAGKAAGQ